MSPFFCLFFFNIFSCGLRPLKCNEIIIGGNFNLVLDTNKDKMGGLNKTHQNSVQVYHEYENALDVVDVWRTLNNEDRRLSWRRRNPEIFTPFRQNNERRYTTRLQNRSLNDKTQ